MQLVQSGDPRAFELVYDRHGGAAFSLAYRMVGNREARRTSCRRRSSRSGAAGCATTRPRERPHVGPRHRPQPGDRRAPAQAWSTTAGGRPLEGIEERHEAPERTDVEVARREEARSVRAALDTLPDDQRRTIELAYFGGFTHSQIAEMLDEPIGTVKGRMRLGLEKMRRQLPRVRGGGFA